MHASVFLFGNYIFFCATTWHFLREDLVFMFILLSLFCCRFTELSEQSDCTEFLFFFFFFSTVSVWWHDLYSPARNRIVEFLLSDVWRRSSGKDAPHANWAVQVANSNQGRIKWLHSTLSLDFFVRSSPSSRRRHKSHLVKFKAKDNIE